MNILKKGIELMSTIKLFHSSYHIINKPDYSLGKSHNDYGQGFYCTENIDLAKEWACKDNKDGFVNEYNFNLDGLKTLNLLDGTYSSLNWIAILLENRIFHYKMKLHLMLKIISSATFYLI